VDAAGRMVALRDGRLTIDDAVDTILSVLPWSPEGHGERGGRALPLDDERLLLAAAVSNEIGDETAVVEVHAGVALV